MLVPLSTQVAADDPIVKTYVKGNVRYWEECTPSGIIVRISSREITHSAGV